MTTATVPLHASDEAILKSLLDDGFADSKAGVFRRAIQWASEEMAVINVLRSQKEISENKVLTGDLRDYLSPQDES